MLMNQQLGIVDYHCLEVIVGSLTLEELLIITV
jgi:hypothetical protein